MAGSLVDDDPETALAHARFAARRGGRVGVVRETYGIVAYRNGSFSTAIRELRTAVRITGRYDLLPMIADCERGLGRPEKALDIAASPEAENLGAASTIEMMIVVAGAYADTGDLSTALASLEIPALRQKVEGAWQVRLWVAYADLLELAGRHEESMRWLTLAADADSERITDAAERLGRPAPAPVDSPWEDDEQITVVDAYVDLSDEDAVEPEDDGTAASDATDPEGGAPSAHADNAEDSAPQELAAATDDVAEPAAGHPQAAVDERTALDGRSDGDEPGMDDGPGSPEPAEEEDRA